MLAPVITTPLPSVITMEAVLFVADYLDDPDDGEGDDAEVAFDDARGDVIPALENLKNELAETIGADGVARLTFSFPDFIEFDSDNASHACAYFAVEVSGPVLLIAMINENEEESDE